MIEGMDQANIFGHPGKNVEGKTNDNGQYHCCSDFYPHLVKVVVQFFHGDVSLLRSTIFVEYLNIYRLWSQVVLLLFCKIFDMHFWNP